MDSKTIQELAGQKIVSFCQERKFPLEDSIDFLRAYVLSYEKDKGYDGKMFTMNVYNQDPDYAIALYFLGELEGSARHYASKQASLEGDLVKLVYKMNLNGI